MIQSARRLPARSWPLIASRSGLGIFIALVVVASFVAHDGLMAGVAAAGGSEHPGADHATSDDAAGQSHPDDCWTAPSADAARIGNDVPSTCGIDLPSPLVFPDPPAVSLAGPPPVIHLLQRGPPRAALQVWRV